MKAYSDFTWLETLYDSKIPKAKLIHHETYPDMYRIEFLADGSISEDFYNKSRAKDNAQKEVCFQANKKAPKTVKKQADTAH